MKTTKLFPIALLVAIAMSSCSDDDKPQTLPTVTTNMDITTTTTTALVSGEITDDGNASITEAGFVYSSNVDEPEITDNKESVTNFEELEAELTGLTSGTIYKVRAYAINKKGVAYGEIRSFETGNLAPIATNVQITGTLEVAKTLTAAYTFTDAEGNDEDLTVTGTAFQWYVADNSTGTNEVAINGATSKTFVLTDAHNGKVLRVKVTPKATAGTLTGAEVFSGYTTAIGAETVTFTYKGVSVTYGTIISASGKKWLDRNLGAAHAAANITDFQAYGDLFQWGRAADGHQVVTRVGINNGDATGVNGTTSTIATVTNPASNQFITDASGFPGDWITPQTSALWQGVNGVNNPCPAGWRVPTVAEWNAEGLTNIDDAYTKLKLPRTGYRTFTDGSFLGTDLGGYYATSTADDATSPNLSYRVRINATSYSSLNVNRGSAYACRCVKN